MPATDSARTSDQPLIAAANAVDQQGRRHLPGGDRRNGGPVCTCCGQMWPCAGYRFEALDREQVRAALRAAKDAAAPAAGRAGQGSPVPQQPERQPRVAPQGGPCAMPITRPRAAITPEGRELAADVLKQVIDIGLDFKVQPEIYRRRLAPAQVRDLLLSDLPASGEPVESLLQEFTSTILPLCKNEANPRFMGFADTGDDLAALAGALLDVFTQQNLINQSFDSPSATFVEMAVLRWLRDLIGFASPPASQVATVWDAGGVITHGGTMSNTIAMMLAREHKAPGTMENGVADPGQFSIIVPRGIGHYSVKSALTWIGVGAQLIEVDTTGYRYDLRALEEALRDHAGRVMAVVAYAGDSRTQTVDDLRGVHDVVRAADERIWLHADACWGLICAFSDLLRPKIDGITGYDSVTVDPHKVMAVPYSLSALLVRKPESLRAVSTYSDLIMQEAFAFGQVTPFVGTRSWLSLKLWMMMRARGRAGLARMAEERCDKAWRFAGMIDAHARLLRIHDPDLAAVAFLYLPAGVTVTGITEPDISRINDANKWIHDQMLDEGLWHLHQFSIPDDTGLLQRGATLHPLRFMAGNPRSDDAHLAGVLDYVTSLGHRYDGGTR